MGVEAREPIGVFTLEIVEGAVDTLGKFEDPIAELGLEAVPGGKELVWETTGIVEPMIEVPGEIRESGLVAVPGAKELVWEIPGIVEPMIEVTGEIREPELGITLEIPGPLLEVPTEAKVLI